MAFGCFRCNSQSTRRTFTTTRAISSTTFLLTHWARGRSRGSTIPLEDAVAVEGAVFYRHTGGNEGLIRSDADGTNAKAINGAYFKTAASAGGIALAFIPYHLTA